MVLMPEHELSITMTDVPRPYPAPISLPCEVGHVDVQRSALWRSGPYPGIPLAKSDIEFFASELTHSFLPRKGEAPGILGAEGF